MSAVRPLAGSGFRAELDRLAHEVLPGGRPALDRLLPLFVGAMGGGGAAIYLDDDGRLKREAQAGGGTFPDEHGEAPDGSLAFEGGLFQWAPASPAEQLPPEALAIAFAIASAAREVRLTHRLRRQDFEAKTRGVQLEALYDVGLAIASTLDFERLCDEILMRAVSLLDARRGALYLREGATMRLRGVFGGSAQGEIDPDSEEGRELLSGHPRPSCCALPGTQNLLGVPIGIDSEAKGMLVVGDKESRIGVGPFPESDRRTLELLANQAAIALENAELHRQSLEKERLEREIELASEIQRRILPKGVPDLPGWELVGWNRPARHVGGDYYDLFPIGHDGRRLSLVVGDVSGKGVPAALLVSTLHSSLRLLVERLGVSPDLLERLNRHILDSSAPNKFITLLLGSLDPSSGELDFLNAGHNPGLLVRADGDVSQLAPGGLPIGLMPGSTYRSERLVLAPGDLLCLYTDGITEATGASDEEFGLDRLASLVGAERRRPLTELRAAIDEALAEFTAGEPQGDDQTLILLRRDA